MKELVDAVTRAANAVATYYETKALEMNPVPPAPTKPLSEDVPAAKPKRAAKKAEVLDDIPEGPAVPDRPTPPGREREITESESVKAVTDTAKLLVAKYSKPVAPDNKPEGFHIAKVLLIEDFKVGRLSDLSHEQRVEFVRAVKEILLDDKKAVATLSRRMAAV